MRERVCKNCGGREYEVVGQNMVKCMFCGTLYVDEHSSKEEEVLTVHGYELAREGKFDEAVEQFDKVLSLYPNSFEAFYGKALAKNKIVIYKNKNGLAKKPRFFGDTIVSILQDEDFQNAVKNAPPEVAKAYQDQAKRIERRKKNFEQIDQKLCYDVVLCCTRGVQGEFAELYESLKSALQEQEIKIFDPLQNKKDVEEEIFYAIKKAKVLLFLANDEKVFKDNVDKSVFDRFLYFINKREKAKSSLILCFDQEKLSLSDFPANLQFCQSVINTTSSTFLQDVVLCVKNAIKNAIKETAKLNTVEVKFVDPEKKKYVQTQSVETVQLGQYYVENVQSSETNKINWIFLVLKNGDFDTAKQLIISELEKDPNNSRLLLAKLLLDTKSATEEEFFSKISNFQDKESIDKFLMFADKDSAENFVDNWEKLVQKIDSVEHYNQFLLYLAKFNTPNREEFIRSAENKAVESMDEQLIQSVLQCFDKTDVDRFVEFYFLIGQKNDNVEYYQKILEIDPGHSQAHMALFLQHFKTDEEILSYKNAQELADIFQYLDEDERNKFVDTVIHLILPRAYLNLQAAQDQLDFYLSYVVDANELKEKLTNIAQFLLKKSYFSAAEKYVSIAISKCEKTAELYFLLILIKCHCKDENDLIKSAVKVTDLTEWETVIALSDEAEAEKYAKIISKANKFRGEKLPLAKESEDVAGLKAKLAEFLERNNKILVEFEKENPNSKGANYYKLQLLPFEKLLKKLDNPLSEEEFFELQKNLKNRFEAMDLTAEASINVSQIHEKETLLGKVKPVQAKREKEEETTKEKTPEEKKEFLRKFCFIFLECFPVLFLSLLLCICIAMPKEVYLYFSQASLVAMILICFIIGASNFIYFFAKRKSMKLSTKIATLFLVVCSVLNLLLFLFGGYIFPSKIEVNNEKEFQTLISNASNCTLVLENDLDMQNIKWKSANFFGTIEGNGHTIKNLHFKDKSVVGLIKSNSGVVRNLNVILAEHEYYYPSCFGVIAQTNRGTIENCTVSGKLTVYLQKDGVFGGIVGELKGGKVENCTVNIDLTITCNGANTRVGGAVGKITASASLLENKINFTATAKQNRSQNAKIGTLVGEISDKNAKVERNFMQTNITCSGEANSLLVAGLVGSGNSASKNNHCQGIVDTTAVTGSGIVAGLYGRFENADLSQTVSKSYSLLEMNLGEFVKGGALVGELNGKIEDCFSTTSDTLFVQKKSVWAILNNCYGKEQMAGKYYLEALKFDPQIWDIHENTYPTLK